MPELDLQLPPGTRLVSLAERPDLDEGMGDHNVSVWPAFMLESPVSNAHWRRAMDRYPQFQLALLGEAGEILAAHNSAPLAWDGTDAGLPTGWEDQLVRSTTASPDEVPTALGALQIVVLPERRGAGYADLMLAAMRANARAHGLRAVMACVRPTWKARYPLTPIERYMTWTRGDGQPFDPWIRLHVRAGGRIVRPSPRSMTVTGTVAEWEAWTGMAFPESGAYIVPGGCEPVTIDRDADVGTYHDSNVWILHSLD
ncbi:MAG TPA: N-acetyltransferase [Candidatus Limnocylindria bacterium]|nr:N-acetyltransferase [Candidatus Limnocylindria bacterium]